MCLDLWHTSHFLFCLHVFKVMCMFKCLTALQLKHEPYKVLFAHRISPAIYYNISILCLQQKSVQR